MNFRFSYIILFFFFTARFFCQDVITKKDSTKIIAKILEVSQDEIKYKQFNYLDGPLFIVEKNEIAYVLYYNGFKQVFQDENKKTELSNLEGYDTVSTKIITFPQQKLGDYIKFNLQVAAVVYNSFSNIPNKNYLGMTSSNEYKSASTKQNVTLNVGFNFLFGKSPFVKHVIGINYLKTKSEYYNDYGSIGYSYYAKYKSDVDYVNIITGLRFTLFKKLHLEPLIALNIVANSSTIRSGTEISFDPQTPPYTRHTSSFENQSTNSSVSTTMSFAPKISYVIPVRIIKIEVYVAYNIALQYKLPWYQFGAHVFPFKKLR